MRWAAKEKWAVPVVGTARSLCRSAQTQPGLDELVGVMSPSRPELFGELLIGADDMALASPVAGAAAVEESGVAGAVAAASAPEAAAAEASALASCFLQAETDMAAAPIRATPTRRRVEVVVICCR